MKRSVKRFIVVDEASGGYWYNNVGQLGGYTRSMIDGRNCIHFSKDLLDATPLSQEMAEKFAKEFFNASHFQAHITDSCTLSSYQHELSFTSSLKAIPIKISFEIKTK